MSSEKARRIVLSRSVKPALDFAEEVVGLIEGCATRFYDCTLTPSPPKEVAGGRNDFERTIEINASYMRDFCGKEGNRGILVGLLSVQMKVTVYSINGGPYEVGLNEAIELHAGGHHYRVLWNAQKKRKEIERSPGFGTGWIKHKPL